MRPVVVHLQFDSYMLRAKCRHRIAEGISISGARQKIDKCLKGAVHGVRGDWTSTIAVDDRASACLVLREIAAIARSYWTRLDIKS